MTVIAFLGLGAMGSRMARRLLDAGSELVVWNRTVERTLPLVEAGAAAAESPADAAARADAVITMLSDPGALREVVSGAGGVSESIRDATTFIEMSTVGPGAITWLRSTLPPGVALLDAPVLGSLSEVENGTLRVFVGGDREIADRWMPLLSTLGTPMYVGPLGAGAAAKLVANSTLFGSLGVLGEALALARALGLSTATAFEVLAATPIAQQAQRRRSSLESGDFPVRFTMDLALKDASLVVEAATEAGADPRIAAAARSWLEDAIAEGRSDSDYAEVIQTIIQMRP